MQEQKVIPYHHGRIKQILREDYNCRLENIHQGYKANRYPGYSEKYNLIDIATGEVLQTNVRLHGLRIVFTQEGYPLRKGAEPNEGALHFLKAIESLKNKHKKGGDAIGTKENGNDRE